LRPPREKAWREQARPGKPHKALQSDTCTNARSRSAVIETTGAWSARIGLSTTPAVGGRCHSDSVDEIGRPPRASAQAPRSRAGALTKKNRQFLDNPGGDRYCFSEPSDKLGSRFSWATRDQTSAFKRRERLVTPRWSFGTTPNPTTSCLKDRCGASRLEGCSSS
jgi:hypothetical protein